MLPGRHWRSSNKPNPGGAARPDLGPPFPRAASCGLDFLPIWQSRGSNEATRRTRTDFAGSIALARAEKDIRAGKLTEWRLVRRDV